MFAIGMIRGKSGVHSIEIPMPVIKKADDVLVQIIELGLDGTDFGIVKAGTPDIAADRNELILGHEMTGVVEEVGKGVKSLNRGDVVTMTVRRGCGQCHLCFHNQSDMCMTGFYTERGIHQIDGFLTGYVVDQEQYILKVPQKSQDCGTFRTVKYRGKGDRINKDNSVSVALDVPPPGSFLFVATLGAL
jgi:threonine dehydrogenase-like Zn-dependent dehydrogenase